MAHQALHAPLHRRGHGGLARYGVVLSHGFTGSPESIRPWAEDLAEAGFTVSMPLLTGHGTQWQDLIDVSWQRWYTDIEAAYLDLASHCDAVFVAGLSMGGALALRLAEHHPVAGLALVNPVMAVDSPLAGLAGLLRHIAPSVPSIGDDILRPGMTEYAYSRTPVAAVRQLCLLLKDTRPKLYKVHAPLTLFRSEVDHVVSPRSSRIIQGRVSSREVRTIVLRNSYHVATLDHDAGEIFSRTKLFFQEITETIRALLDLESAEEKHG
ncbi:alpha/beta fold hydrolase [Acaricomes phytoseiuli]|uniref:alpha/beta hydrolase n=1 Tax=Acaricomes phytoseiuli TaxID=291968 RepID=UPI00036742AA|nr:alpha/beta fold hydrolase [Acaricomes phytoseiuli]MCW1249532.1 alpha/beta fold hydrolase [Acaricomes phytoseiuli]